MNENKPRERLLHLGSRALLNAELISILLGSGSSRESVDELSNRILKEFGGKPNAMSNLTVHDLSRFSGIGLAKASSILAGIELGRRVYSESRAVEQKILCSSDAFEIVRYDMHSLRVEEFWCLFLNSGNQLIEKRRISVGLSNAVLVDKKEIVRLALNMYASKLVLAHNHPSGNIKASKEDVELTVALREALEVFDIKLVDHLILYNDQYLSFSDKGYLSNS